MKVVITDKINFDASSRKKLEKIPDIKIYDDVPTSEKDIIERIKDAEIATAWYIDITREIIESAPKLKYIVVPAVGTEWVDSKAATEKGIKVLNCPTFNSQAVAEHAIGLMFAVKRQIVAAHQSILNMLNSLFVRYFRDQKLLTPAIRQQHQTRQPLKARLKRLMRLSQFKPQTSILL